MDGDGEHIKHFLNPKFNRSSELIVCFFMSNNLQITSNCIHCFGDEAVERTKSCSDLLSPGLRLISILQ